MRPISEWGPLGVKGWGLKAGGRGQWISKGQSLSGDHLAQGYM